MPILNTPAPTYKTAATANVVQPAASTSGLSGLIGSLLGNATPAYKTVGGQGVQAPASSGGLFGLLPAAPSYATAPAVAATDDDLAATPDVDGCGSPATDDPCDGPTVQEADAVVLL